MHRKILISFLLILVMGILFLGFASFSRSSLYDISAVFSDKTSNIVFVLDAGHGGIDSGAVSKDGLLEKDVNLSITLSLDKFLKINGFETLMTRSEDISINDEGLTKIKEIKVSDIKNRVEIANSRSNNVLVSIHQNHFDEEKYFGAQAFYSKNSNLSKTLAQCVIKPIKTLIQPNNYRESKVGENIYLLDNSSVASVILECGFLSNDDESFLLSTDLYRNKISFCIFLGLLDFSNIRT